MQPPQSVLGRNFVGCNLRRVLLGRNVLMTLTQGPNFDFDFFDLGSDLIFDSGLIFIFLYFLNLDDGSRSILDFWLRVDFYFIFLIWMMTPGQFLIFDLGSNFDSLNDDSGSRFIYIWLSKNDSRSRISFSLYDLRSRFNLWLLTWGLELFWLRGGLLVFEA